MTQTPDFDSIKQTNPYGMEYWSARDLMPLLGYKKWQKFEDAIARAMTACTQSGNIVDQHFTDAGKHSKCHMEVSAPKLTQEQRLLVSKAVISWEITLPDPVK